MFIYRLHPSKFRSWACSCHLGGQCSLLKTNASLSKSGWMSFGRGQGGKRESCQVSDAKPSLVWSCPGIGSSLLCWRMQRLLKGMRHWCHAVCHFPGRVSFQVHYGCSPHPRPHSHSGQESFTWQFVGGWIHHVEKCGHWDQGENPALSPLGQWVCM